MPSCKEHPKRSYLSFRVKFPLCPKLTIWLRSLGSIRGSSHRFYGIRTPQDSISQSMLSRAVCITVLVCLGSAWAGSGSALSLQWVLIPSLFGIIRDPSGVIIDLVPFDPTNASPTENRFRFEQSVEMTEQNEIHNRLYLYDTHMNTFTRINYPSFPEPGYLNHLPTSSLQNQNPKITVLAQDFQLCCNDVVTSKISPSRVSNPSPDNILQESVQQPVDAHSETNDIKAEISHISDFDPSPKSVACLSEDSVTTGFILDTINIVESQTIHHSAVNEETNILDVGDHRISTDAYQLDPIIVADQTPDAAHTPSVCDGVESDSGPAETGTVPIGASFNPISATSSSICVLEHVLQQIGCSQVSELLTVDQIAFLTTEILRYCTENSVLKQPFLTAALNRVKLPKGSSKNFGFLKRQAEDTVKSVIEDDISEIISADLLQSIRMFTAIDESRFDRDFIIQEARKLHYGLREIAEHRYDNVVSLVKSSHIKPSWLRQTVLNHLGECSINALRSLDSEFHSLEDSDNADLVISDPDLDHMVTSAINILDTLQDQTLDHQESPVSETLPEAELPSSLLKQPSSQNCLSVSICSEETDLICDSSPTLATKGSLTLTKSQKRKKTRSKKALNASAVMMSCSDMKADREEASQIVDVTPNDHIAESEQSKITNNVQGEPSSSTVGPDSEANTARRQNLVNLLMLSYQTSKPVLLLDGITSISTSSPVSECDLDPVSVSHLRSHNQTSAEAISAAAIFTASESFNHHLDIFRRMVSMGEILLTDQHDTNRKAKLKPIFVKHLLYLVVQIQVMLVKVLELDSVKQYADFVMDQHPDFTDSERHQFAVVLLPEFLEQVRIKTDDFLLQTIRNVVDTLPDSVLAALIESVTPISPINISAVLFEDKPILSESVKSCLIPTHIKSNRQLTDFDRAVLDFVHQLFLDSELRMQQSVNLSVLKESVISAVKNSTHHIAPSDMKLDFFSDMILNILYDVRSAIQIQIRTVSTDSINSVAQYFHQYLLQKSFDGITSADFAGHVLFAAHKLQKRYLTFLDSQTLYAKSVLTELFDRIMKRLVAKLERKHARQLAKQIDLTVVTKDIIHDIDTKPVRLMFLALMITSLPISIITSIAFKFEDFLNFNAEFSLD